jgi:hypothetical protein
LSSFIISALHAFVRRDVKRHAPSLSCGTMPASSVIRVAFFALGAAVGGGTVVAINASRKKEALVRATASTTQTLPPTSNGPLVEVGVTGSPRLTQAAGAAAALAAGPVLKYGNPGMYDTLMATISVNEQRLMAMCQAPFSTNLCAERMSLDMIVACDILRGSVSSSNPPRLSCPSFR